MLKHPDLTRRRIEKYIQQTLQARFWEQQIPLAAAVYQPTEDLRDYRLMLITPESAAQYDYETIEPGSAWGPVYSDAWFLLQGTIPEEWKGKTVVARLDLGAEAIVWEGDDPIQGIDGNHPYVLLSESALGGEKITLHVQATGMNPDVSVSGKPKAPSPTPFTFRHALLAVYDGPLFQHYFDLSMAYAVMREQPEDSPRYGQLLAALNEVVNLYEESEPEMLSGASERLRGVFQRPASASAHKISAIGHAPLAMAWLWPLERTQYKCLHTWATVVRYMEAYPEFKFVASQAAQYEWVRRLAPKLYDRIKAKIKNGQWEVAGSMWVEADCNLSSGESLVRQILLGKNFFQDEFGVETRDLRLPDGFGYAAALPQILKKAGIDYFLTQKINGNQRNEFPHHTFLWQGIDGTRVFTHYPPADTYNAALTPKELAYNVRNFREHDRATRSLYLFGHGDGGPTAEMLENARRLANIEGMPTVTIEKALDFFRKAEAEALGLPVDLLSAKDIEAALAAAPDRQRNNLAVWVGELYLELHRGTYTTQARNKRNNRRCEFALRDAEFLSVVSPAGLTAYPLVQLDRAWKTTLLNQFHDILSGSGINEVYRDSDQDYAEVLRITRNIIANASGALAAQIDTRGLKQPVLVLSNLSHFANEAVAMPLKQGQNPVAAVGPEGDVLPVQIVTGEGGIQSALWIAKNVPLHGYSVWDLNATTVPASLDEEVTVTPTSLENAVLRVEFDAKTGLITRLFDKDREREVLNDTYEVDRKGSPTALIPAQCANQFQLFEDKPLFWDAQNVDVYYQEKGRTLTELDHGEVVENGPVRGAIRFVRSFGKSKITQTVRLTAGSARLDFITYVDWHETDRMLKVAFPVAINSARATYEIQYGHVERPTHYNTSWDLARFEVCAQKWVDLSEGDYGVALLNDCKYGHDIHGNVLRLTLLRAPQAPDPDADRGHHTLTYSLLPHGGDFREGEVVENAYALNTPPLVRAITANQPGPFPLERTFFELDNAGVFIEAIKKAEKEEAVIVRLYEAHNTRGTVALTTTLPVRKAYLADLMENNIYELPLFGGEVTLPIQPFEIVTIKFVF